MAVFVVDSFTEASDTTLASHTGETGATWTLHPSSSGVFTLVGSTDRIYVSTQGPFYYASGTPASADYDVAGVLVQLNTQASQVGVVARMQTASNAGYWARYNATTAAWELLSHVGGTATTLGSYAQALTNGVEYTVTVRAEGTSIKVLVDGVERISVTDSGVTAAGRAGVRGNTVGGSTTRLQLTSVSATDIVAAELHTGTAAVTGGGAIAATGTKRTEGAAAVSGGGAVVATGSKRGEASVAVTGGGATAATGTKRAEGAATVSGGGSVAASGVQIEPGVVLGSSAVTGGGTVAATGRKLAHGTVYVTGGGAVAATGTASAGPVVPQGLTILVPIVSESYRTLPVLRGLTRTVRL